MNDISKEKKDEFRKEILKRLRNQEPSKREERSKKIQEKLLSSEEFRSSTTIMTYVSMPSEVDTYYLNEEALKQGKRIIVPYIDPETHEMIATELLSLNYLKEGPFGIYQPEGGSVKPVPLKEIDLVVIPAIAYDKQNMRLGRGKGYYDRFLAGGDASGTKIVGLAFHFQVVDVLPSDPHDKSVFRVITD